MKILLISHDSSLYGAQRSLIDLALELKRKGHEIEVCVPRKGSLVGMLEELGVVAHILPYGRWIPSASKIWKLPKITYKIFLFPKIFLNIIFGSMVALFFLNRKNYSAIYSNTVTVINFAIAAKIIGIPHIWHLRESAQDDSRLLSIISNRRVISIVNQLSALVIYNSKYLLRQYGEAESSRAVVIYNGIDPHAFPPRPWPTPVCNNLRIVIIGYMVHLKGLDVLLDALISLDNDLLKRISLLVVGEIDSIYKREIINPRLIKLGEHVEFYGKSSDVSKILQSTDLLISSSRQETFGRTVVEAMFTALPVLATKSGGPEEIVVNEVTGLLVQKESPEELARGINRFLSEPDFLPLLGKAGRERAMQFFSLEHQVNSIEQAITHALHLPSGYLGSHTKEGEQDG